MSPEERQLLTGLFDRIHGASANPRDKEAEAFIDDAVRALPYAPYLLSQTVIVQDQALQAANQRLQELEGKVKTLEEQAARAPQGSGGFLSGLGSLFGGAPPPPSPPRSPAPPPGWQQQPPQGGWQQPQQGYGQPQAGPWGGQPGGGQFGGGQGGGFLKGALGAAAGVAGGVLLADSIRGLFGGHGNPLGIGSGYGGIDQGLSGLGGGETVINNYYGSDDQALRQADAQQDADQDQDDIQDASDYGSDFDSGDDGSADV